MAKAGPTNPLRSSSIKIYKDHRIFIKITELVLDLYKDRADLYKDPDDARAAEQV